MHYLVVVGYESDQMDKAGNPKVQKIKYVVEGDSVEEVTLSISNYRSEDRRGSEVLSIQKMPIDCVIDMANTPQYYK